jgi:FkbM family methyltransferase
MVPFLGRIVRPKTASALAKYLYLAEALADLRIELVIDVGANVGQFGQTLRAIGYRGRILSFEPLDDAFRALQALTASDAAWDAQQLALGDRAGSADLGVMRSRVFSSFHTPVSTQPLADFAEQNVIERRQAVAIRRLDTLVDELSLRPLLPRAMLKSDTQGHDRHVLEGMAYISEVALLQVEMTVLPLYESTPAMPEMIQYVDALGFAPILLSPVGRAQDGRAIEFDYLGVNARLLAASSARPERSTEGERASCSS